MSTFRLCVDLNVWINQFLAEARGRRGTIAQSIVEAVQAGRAGVGPVQLVISFPMLTRLQDVLTRKGVSLQDSSQFISIISAYCALGPTSEFPRMVLGGGVEPTRDAKAPAYDPRVTPRPYDPEDGRVLDAALSARAHALVTANFKDFVDHQDTVIVRGRVHVRNTASHRMYVVQPPEMAAWLRTGRPPVAPQVRATPNLGVRSRGVV